MDCLHAMVLDELEPDPQKMAEYLLDVAEIVFKYSEASYESERGKLHNEYIRIASQYSSNVSLQDYTPLLICELVCEACESPMQDYLLHMGDMICRNCGACQPAMEDGIDNVPYGHEQERPPCPYRRTNHFNEWLAQYQGRNASVVPSEVFETILCELKKERCYNPESLTKEKIRNIMKRMRLNKYYESVSFVLSRLQGKSPPRMSPDLEERLRQMFIQIQPVFQKHCPENRKNFLSYSFVLNKLCYILGEVELSNSFCLLKSREKLLLQVSCKGHHLALSAMFHLRTRLPAVLRKYHSIARQNLHAFTLRRIHITLHLLLVVAISFIRGLQLQDDHMHWIAVNHYVHTHMAQSVPDPLVILDLHKERLLCLYVVVQ